MIFDANDEILFSQEPSTSIDSQIHFRIHRWPLAGQEDHNNNILNDLFGSLSYSPDKGESGNQSEITQQIGDQELHFPAFSSLPSPFPVFPRSPQELSKNWGMKTQSSLGEEDTLTSDVNLPTPRRSPQEFSKDLDMEEESSLKEEDTLTSDVNFPTQRRSSQQELSKDLGMEEESSLEEEDKLISNANPSTPTRSQELLNNSEMQERNVFQTIFSNQVSPISDCTSSEEVQIDEKRSQPLKRKISKGDCRKVKNRVVTEWNLSNILT